MPWCSCDITWVNSLRPRRNGRYNADDIFKCIFLKENVRIPTKISLKFVRKGPINNIPALVQIMAWRRPGDKPFSEPMIVSLLTHTCVTRPQWVNADKCNLQITRGHLSIKMPSYQYRHSHSHNNHYNGNPYLERTSLYWDRAQDLSQYTMTCPIIRSVKSQNSEINILNYLITLKFHRLLNSSAAEMPFRFQRDQLNLIPKLTAVRFKIIRKDILSDIGVFTWSSIVVPFLYHTMYNKILYMPNYSHFTHSGAHGVCECSIS